MIVIRHARSADREGILSCLTAAFEPYRHQYTPAAFVDTVLTRDSLSERMTKMSLFVAEDGGGIIGTIAAAPVGRQEGHLRGMAVLPGKQRHGAGRRLLRRALDDLAARGCRRVTLDTTAPLESAVRFYESAGFSRTDRVQDFFGMPLSEFAISLDDRAPIREASLDDVPALLRVINDAYLVERGFVKGDRLTESELRGYFARGTFLVAVDEQRPIACVFLQPTAPDRAYLGLLAVDPLTQGHGLGRFMMAAAERRCRDAGSRAIDIRVVNLRTELPPFYASLGFVPNGTAPFVDARLFKPAHFLVMTLVLDDGEGSG
jgi:GNAT superfamily N-acetyltransferase